MKSDTTYPALNTLLLLLPCWLLIFYFREKITGWLVYDVINLSEYQEIAGLLVSFFATLLKISLLLVLFVFIISFLRTWIPASRIKKKLGSMHPVTSNFLAGILGVLTPFCSCSAIPVFVGFLEAGIPLGTTFTFLIASPLVNEIILIMLAGLFGIRITFIYLLSGLFIAILGGVFVTRLKLEKYLPAWILEFRNERDSVQNVENIDARVRMAFKSVKETFARTWVYIIAGIVAGTLIHGYVPDTWLNTLMGGGYWYKLPLIILAGIPLYACSAAVVPVAFALVSQGIPAGTALAFIMSVVALSLPEFIMLKRIISARLVLIFIAIVFSGILITGYLFNWLL